MYFLICAVVLLLDFVTKRAVDVKIPLNGTVEVFPGIFDLTYVRNKGAAFGIFYGKTGLLIAVTVLLLLALSVYAVLGRNKHPKMETVSLALICAGGAGNLISRIIHGYVIDFFNFYFWPIFNVADIAICIGCGLLILSVLILEPLKEKKKTEE